MTAANHSEVDTGQGRTGLEAEAFVKLAGHHEVRVRQAAESFKDPLRRIVALAAIDQARAQGLASRKAPTAKP